MILPVVAYGHPVLKKKAQEIGPDYPDLKQFISDFWETMYEADGVGLAAPQVNRSIRIFAIDASPFVKDHPETDGLKKMFINAEIYNEEGDEWIFNEGCLSFPGMREDISRKPLIRIRWVDEDFQPHDQMFDGIVARVIQHEYDHIEGILMVDRITSLKRVLLKRRLNDITKGNVDTSYKMLFPQPKKRKI
ncbi:MAG: peptide deformylase [Bacteroidetes bacterium]|nr:peptide deformylase [Bacteroidota bacterium]